ncbi:MAG: hypothetical protein A4E55_00615 [Pelotomaculum sp. PtaU1.Bin035]|nr:MAG: hypothetical protein A4E55_00615 [Pelotomaculum sp. PtaU1.Bin035]
MDIISVGLVLFAIILFAVTLSLSLRLPRIFKLPQKAKKTHNHISNSVSEPHGEHKQNTITLKLPWDGKYNNTYNIDFRLSLANNSKNEQNKKDSIISTGLKKKFHRNFDEYFK